MAMLLNNNPNLENRNRLLVFIWNNWKPSISAILATSNNSIPILAILRTVALFGKKMPLNISTTPNMAENIIAFILFRVVLWLFYKNPVHYLGGYIVG